MEGTLSTTKPRGGCPCPSVDRPEATPELCDRHVDPRDVEFAEEAWKSRSSRMEQGQNAGKVAGPGALYEALQEDMICPVGVCTGEQEKIRSGL